VAERWSAISVPCTANAARGGSDAAGTGLTSCVGIASFSLWPRPAVELPRRGLVVLGRRTPEREELRELTDDLVIVEVGWTASDGSDPKEPVYELAMSDAALTGFLSWLESLPPGVLWRDSDDE